MIGFSCTKKFDEPPAFTGPEISANHSIIQLKGLHFPGNFEQLMDDWILEGIVIANDSADNFYKSIIIQDSTGGITLKLDATGLYSDYPVGMKTAIRLKGLWIGDYGGMLQIGGGVDRTDPVYPALTAIPFPLIDRYVVKKDLNNPVVPNEVSIDQLNDSLQSCLVKINNIEFAISDTGKTYADAINKQSVNMVLKVCGGGSIYLRTSGFAGFAKIKTPRGNGTITAVYTVFNSEKQLMIRDTGDIQLAGLRCTGSGAKILLNEDFENTAPNTDLFVPGWKNIAELGGRSFQAQLAGNNHYAEINSLATGQGSVVSWLISPPINLSNSANEILSFQTRDGYDNGAVLQAYISNNYDGGNAPSKAKWTLLKANISKGSVSGFAGNWVSSGNIGLSGFSGSVYLAFRYEGADPPAVIDKRTTSFQIDNVKILGN